MLGQKFIISAEDVERSTTLESKDVGEVATLINGSCQLWDLYADVKFCKENDIDWIYAIMAHDNQMVVCESLEERWHSINMLSVSKSKAMEVS
mgnify:FL=1